MKILLQTACIALLLAPATAAAQRGDSERRVYCWEEGGRKICGDALPASAVDSARTEISATTGARRAQVGRALTPQERAEAEREAREAVERAEAAAAARRRDIAMVESYATEADLHRAYDNRIVLIDESIKTSQMGVSNLRMSLLAQLRQAAELELHSRPVNKPLADNIRSQHADLMRQQAILRQQLGEREELDSSLREALERYRDLTGGGGRDDG